MPPPRHFMTRRSVLRLLAAAAGVGLYTWRVEPHWLEIVRRPLPIRNLPRALDGLSLLQLSDLHVGPVVDDAYILDVFAHGRARRRHRRPYRRHDELPRRSLPSASRGLPPRAARQARNTGHPGQSRLWTELVAAGSRGARRRRALGLWRALPAQRDRGSPGSPDRRAGRSLG